MARVNTDFATEALVEFHYYDEINISLTITDENDILALKEILKGRSFKEGFHCGFSIDTSITMTNGSKSLIFCPAHDGCPLLRIGDKDGYSNRYIRISEEQRKTLDKVLAKYGMFFPCI